MKARILFHLFREWCLSFPFYGQIHDEEFSPVTVFFLIGTNEKYPVGTTFYQNKEDRRCAIKKRLNFTVVMYKSGFYFYCWTYVFINMPSSTWQHSWLWFTISLGHYSVIDTNWKWSMKLEMNFVHQVGKILFAGYTWPHERGLHRGYVVVIDLNRLFLNWLSPGKNHNGISI